MMEVLCIKQATLDAGFTAQKILPHNLQSVLRVTRKGLPFVYIRDKIKKKITKKMKLVCLQSVATRWFSYLGMIVGKHPQFFVIFPILLSIALSTGMLNIKFKRNLFDMLVAKNGKAEQESKLVENLFKNNSSDFAPIYRETIMYDMTTVQAISKDEGSIFRKKVFDEVYMLDRMIRNFSTIWNGSSLNFSMICGKRFNKCIENKIFELASYIKKDRLEKHAVKYPVELNNVTFALKEYVFFLGGVETDDKGYLEDGKAIRIFYAFDLSNQSKLAAIRHWTKRLNMLLSNARFEYIDHSFLNTELIERELEKFSDALFRSIPIVASVILIFTFLSYMTDNWIRSKPLVGASSCFSALLAITSGFSLCLHAGVSFTDYHLLVAFGILATEVDDAFILLASWRHTNPRDSVTQRMRQTYSMAGVSITVTSVTNIISYCIGIFTPYTLIRYICIYSAVTMLFSYLYLITFFGGCLALDGYREEKGQNPLTFICSKDASLCENEEIQEEYFMSKFRTTLGELLKHSFAKLIVVIIFVVNLTVGLWGLTFIKYGNDASDIFPENSMCTRTVIWTHKYFNTYTYPIHVVIDYPLNYADAKVQTAIEELMKKLEVHPHIADSALRLSWLKYYKLFVNSLAGRFSLRGYNISDKADFIDGLRNVFLKFHQAKQFQQDIVFNENYSEIIASRFLIPTKDITDVFTELKVKIYVEETVEQSQLPVRVFSFNFHMHEQAQLIKSVTLTTSIAASCLIFLVFFIFVPNLNCSLCIFTTVICMFFEAVGYMSLWEVKLDIPSLVTLIVCIGFSINYPTHISFSYVKFENMKPEDRICNALSEVGLPIVQGSVSTILGISVLLFQSYYVAYSCCKVIIIMTFQTAFHSLFFIQVLLSIFGRCDQSLSVKKSQVSSDIRMKMLEPNQI